MNGGNPQTTSIVWAAETSALASARGSYKEHRDLGGRLARFLFTSLLLGPSAASLLSHSYHTPCRDQIAIFLEKAGVLQS